MKNCLVKSIAVAAILAFAAFSDEGRSIADDWPSLQVFRELELRGLIELQPNVWPLRSGRMLSALPSNPVDEQTGIWSKELRRTLESTILKNNTVTVIFEPGIDAILNNPRDPNDRFYPKFLLGGGMAKGPVEGFVSYDVNLKWAREENYRGRQWSGFAGRPDQVYLRADDSDWGVQFGKDYLSWGEGLVLGRAHDPFDRIDYEVDIGRLRFSGFNGWLDPLDVFTASGDTLIRNKAQRYLAGHRLEFLSKHFSVALYETILYGGVGRPLEAIYTVPFYWFHAQQLNLGLDDNTMVGGDFQVLLPPARLSLEFLVDDIQVEKQSQGDEEPPEIALAVQADLGTTIAQRWVTFSARYEGVTNWTYNQNKVWNRYLYMNQPLGSELGNDADRASLGAKIMLSPAMLINLEGFYSRRGEGRIEAFWSEPWIHMEGNYTEPFPTGVVEETAGGILEIAGSIWPYLFWNADLEIGTKKDFLHESGAKMDYWSVGLGLSCATNIELNIR